MLAEALKFFSELAQKSQAPTKLDQPDPRKAVYAVGGSLVDVDLPPPPREHQPGTLAEVIALANRFAGDGAHPVVWYDQDQVVLVIDDLGHRIEHATLALQRSDVLDRLIQLRATKPWLDQKDALRLVRIELAGTLAPDVLLDRLRKIKIENGQAVTSHVRHGAESMGRSINAAVSGEGEIPEGVVLDVPAYKTPGEADRRYGLACSIEVEPTRGLQFFRLMPLPDELERVEALAVASIGERLVEGLDDAIPAYQGRP
jgi:hypothetical protein